MTSCFSMPPMRCSSPGVPGRTHGRASVAGSRRYGKKPSGSVRKLTSIGGSVVGSGISHGSEPLARIAVGEHHDRHHVLDGDPHRLVGDVEAVARAWPARCTTIGDSLLRP